MLTQPTAGDFKAFSAVCTHQGCIVAEIKGADIDCACHGSKFTIKDGSVVNGPATKPLEKLTARVKGDEISVSAWTRQHGPEDAAGPRRSCGVGDR